MGHLKAGMEQQKKAAVAGTMGRTFSGLKGRTMQVLCKSTSGNAEMLCSICGQGFVMFWERQSRAQRVEALHQIRKALRHQHRSHKGPEAHPNGGFLVPPNSNGPGAPLGTSTPGQVPSWDL